MARRYTAVAVHWSFGTRRLFLFCCKYTVKIYILTQNRGYKKTKTNKTKEMKKKQLIRLEKVD